MGESIKIRSAQIGDRVTVEIKKETYEVEVVIKPKARVGEITKNKDFYYNLQMLNGEEQLDERIEFKEKRILIEEELAREGSLISFIFDGYCKGSVFLYPTFFRPVLLTPTKRKKVNKNYNKGKTFKPDIENLLKYFKIKSI